MTLDVSWKAWTEDEDTTLRLLVENAKDRFGEVVWTLVPEMPNRTLCAMRKRTYALARGTTKNRAPPRVKKARPPSGRPKPERLPDGCERPCITCRRPFNSPDRKRVWMCDRCKNPSAHSNSYIRMEAL